MEIKAKIFGYTKEQLLQIAKGIISSNRITISVDEEYLDALLTLQNNGESDENFKVITSEIFMEVRDNLYAEGDITLGQMVVDYLTLHNKKLAVAESLTGGLICNQLVEISGASKVLYEGLVTYSNESKIDRLKVSENTIESSGAVSYECAYEMAMGLLDNNNIDVAVSTTGIAGPMGGTDIKPVGLTYICVADKDGYKVCNHCFSGDRKSIRMQATYTALFYIINLLKNR